MMLAPNFLLRWKKRRIRTPHFQAAELPLAQRFRVHKQAEHQPRVFNVNLAHLALLVNFYFHFLNKS
jgi:hypothetical protein